MHQKLISLEGNTIFEKVKRLYKCLCICRARNLQRSWDLSLVNVKGLMISAYCRKLEKYSCTQMSLRSGYELHLCHNQIFSTPVRFHFLQHFSPHHMQKHKLQSSSRPVPIISGNTQTCASHISPKMSFSLIFSSDSQITPSLQHHTQKLSKESQGSAFINIFR